MKVKILMLFFFASLSAHGHDQNEFVDNTCNIKNEYVASINELQKAKIRNKRKQFYKTFFKENLKIDNWRGNIVQLGIVGENKIHLSVRLNCGIELTTWNNAFSDISTGSLISLYGEIGDKLINAEVGQRIIFSGIFVLGDRDYIEEQSITQSGSLTNPEFTFLFTSID